MSGRFSRDNQEPMSEAVRSIVSKPLAYNNCDDQHVDTFAGAVERTTIERANLRAKVGFAETMLQLIRESAADEKIRAIAAGAIETLKEMP